MHHSPLQVRPTIGVRNRKRRVSRSSLDLDLSPLRDFWKNADGLIALVDFKAVHTRTRKG